jgi:hypothetical protein
MNHRAYSLLEIKGVQEDSRIITGIATTPAPDRVGDVVEPLGVSFKNPMPLLWHHDSRHPVGKVWFDKPTKDGIGFKAQLPHIAEPGALKDRVDTAWGEIKYDLLRGVSIGFRDLEFSRIDTGLRFIKTEVLELSLVSIPANVQATIDTIKSIDAAQRAAPGHATLDGTEGIHLRRRHGIALINAVNGREATTMKRTIAEQISAFEGTRQAKAARMKELMDLAADAGETLSAEASQEYDGLELELKELDAHLVRLRNHEELNKRAVVPAAGQDEHQAASSRGAGGGVRVEVRGRNLPEGIAFTRFVIAKAIGARDMRNPADVAKERWPDMPELEIMLKAPVAVGTTADSVWAGPLAPIMQSASEFVAYLWPRTIIGRIPGLTRVPFRTKVPRQTAVAAVNWVGEGKPKPLGAGAFDTIDLPNYKIAGIVVLTEELIRFSNPSAEALTRDMLANGIVKLMDRDFIDPDKALVANVSPASITNGVTPVIASGTNYAAFVTDLKKIMANFDAATIEGGFVAVMRTGLARSMSLMLNPLGQPQFGDLSEEGGTLQKIPVITSTNVPLSDVSPALGSPISIFRAADIFLADDGGVSIDISREASVEMESAPAAPTAGTIMVSLWQQNMVGIRAERACAWLRARAGSVQVIENANYG